MTEVSKHTPGQMQVSSQKIIATVHCEKSYSDPIRTGFFCVEKIGYFAGGGVALFRNSDDAHLFVAASEMREAAAPFAAYGYTLLGQKVRDDNVMVELWDHKITVGDFRKLALAFAKAEGGAS